MAPGTCQLQVHQCVLVACKHSHALYQSDYLLAGLLYAGRNPREEFKAERIPDSRFFDVDKISDLNSDLPHMLPTEEAFAAAADALGIERDTQVPQTNASHPIHSHIQSKVCASNAVDVLHTLAGGHLRPEWDFQRPSCLVDLPCLWP